MKLFTIPNLLTLGNLFCGCLAVISLFTLPNQSVFGSNDPLIIVSILLSISLLFDLLDGMVARAMKINSEIGVQLDSLADMVTFGFVPGLMMLILLGDFEINPSESSFLPFIGFLITLFSALRLAKFNVDTEQSTYFKGLATPANTILIFSLFWIQNQNGFILSKEYDLYFLIGITLLSCYLLIANLPLFSFKFKGFAWKDNDYKYLFLIISLILLVLFQMNSVPFIILLYIITSILFKKKIIHVA
ncbi:CDP-alcohol phosphatidyltransferase family protein [Moheibacter sp.]|uniref:CDP-alcohol phosphatidyltransferase family protein n=1 Tax=Moheibacter sp. TaxID=1965316 RepID=UPI003C793627